MNSVSLRQVREIMSATGTYRVPFNNIYRSADGFVARQTAVNDPHDLGLTWILGRNMESEIIVPIPKFRRDNLTELGNLLNGYENASRFVGICRAQKYLSPTIIDLNMLLLILLGVSRTQAALSAAYGWEGPLFAKIKLSGIWRTIPFFDAAHVLDEYAVHGVPLALKDATAIRSGKGIGSFIELPADDDNDTESFRVMTALRLFIAISASFGVLFDDAEDEQFDPSTSMLTFLEAGQRAIEVQRRRAEQSRS